MRTIWQSLAWKEWHEHKWKLAAIVAVLCGVSAIFLGFADALDTYVLAVSLVGMCIVPLAMFIGLGAAANECSRNTLPFLQSLPAPLWRVALMKVVFGLITLIVGIVLAVAFIYVWRFVAEIAGQRTGAAIRQLESHGITGNWYIDCVILIAPFAASLFAWSAAMGVNRRDEISAGAITVAVVVGWFALLSLAFSVVVYWMKSASVVDPDRYRWLVVVGLSTLPGGIFPAIDLSRSDPPITLVVCYTTMAITHLLLLVWYVRRFGRISNREIRSPQAAIRQSARADWLPSPRRSAISAIVWKQIRESGPIALAGVAGAVGTTLVVMLIDTVEGRRFRADFVGEVYPKMAVVFGCFVALVAGIGVCLNDTSPRVNEFWRSRPIQPDLWFWIKFATGLVVVLTSIYVPIALLAVFQLLVFDPDAYSMPAIHLAVFAAAVMTTCLVRQAVYAAILSIAVVYLGTLFGLVICFLPRWLQPGSTRPNLFADPTAPEVIFGLAVSFAISTLVAWLAVRYDWGKKSRY